MENNQVWGYRVLQTVSHRIRIHIGAYQTTQTNLVEICIQH